MPSSSGTRLISKDRCRIAIGDLEAEDTGRDETQERDECEQKRVAESVEGECSQNEEEGDEHRANKNVNHFKFQIYDL